MSTGTRAVVTTAAFSLNVAKPGYITALTVTAAEIIIVGADASIFGPETRVDEQ
jgi:hypothetical protein